MIKQSELEVMVCDLFVDAYRAGASGAEHSYGSARNGRAKLIEAIGNLYAELENESYEREKFQVELYKANQEIDRLTEEIDRLTEEIDRRKAEKAAIFNGAPCPGMKTRLSEIYGSKLTDPDEEVPDHHDAFDAIDAMFPGCTPDDLPFPDVDDLAPASELLGGDE